jgi:hypothetical protein
LEFDPPPQLLPVLDSLFQLLCVLRLLLSDHELVLPELLPLDWVVLEELLFCWRLLQERL